MMLSKSIWILATTSLAWALTLNVSTPTQCDNLQVTWTGGQGPFTVLLTPVFGTPRAHNVSAGQSSLQTQLAFLANQKMLVTLFDYSTQASISTNILVVGNSLGGSCNATDPGVDFTYELNTALQQCRPYTFSGYSGALQPVLIYGLIPLGQTFILQPPVQSTSFSWVANVAAGTSIVFFMVDSEGRNGGSSDIEQVGNSDDSTCLDGSSPSSTALSTPTSTSTPTTTAPAPAAPSKLSTGVIMGAVGGAVILIAALVGLTFFFLRMRNSRRHPRSDIDLSYEPTRAPLYPHNISSSTNLTRPDPPPDSPLPPHHAPMYSSAVPPSQYEPRPFILPPSDSQSSIYPHSRHSTTNSRSDLLSGDVGEQNTSSSSSMSTSQRKAAMAGVTSYKPSRFIVHTDLDETLTTQEEEIVELPPQYSESRRPLQLLNPSEPTSPSTQPPYHSTVPHS